MSAGASRRGFLRGLTAFSAGAATAVPTLVAASAPPPPDGDLLALGRKLSDALAELDRCEEAMAWAREHFEASRPEIPDEIKLPGLQARWVQGEWPPSARRESDAAAVNNSIRIPCRWDLDRIVSATDGRTVLGKRVRRVKKVSDAFHSAHTEARYAAGIPQAAEHEDSAIRAVLDVGFAIMALESKTLAGLAVKGRAGLAMHRAWKTQGTFNRQEASYASLCANLVALDPSAVGCASRH